MTWFRLDERPVEIVSRSDGRATSGRIAVGGRGEAFRLLGRIRHDPLAHQSLRALVAEAGGAPIVGELDDGALRRRVADLLASGALVMLAPEGLSAAPLGLHKDDDATEASQPAAAAGAQEKGFGVTSISAPERVAPGAEEMVVAFTIKDDQWRTTQATLEIRRKSDDAPLWSVTLKDNATRPDEKAKEKIGSSGYAGAWRYVWRLEDGTWAGPAAAGRAMPWYDSPFVVRVSIRGSGTPDPPKQEAEVKVELDAISLQTGPAEWISDARQRAAFEALLTKADFRLRLEIERFPLHPDELGYAESSTADDPPRRILGTMAYFLHEDAWSQGGRAPLKALVTLKNSAGKGVAAPAGLGDARVRWTFVDPSSVVPIPGIADSSQEFVDKALAYRKDAGDPPGGDNAHVAFGGKRTGGKVLAAVGASPFAGLAFEVPADRAWEAEAGIAREGEHKACAAVMLNASRIGGDNYQLKAELVRPAVAAAALAKTAKPITVWRRLRLRGWYRKSTTVQAVDLAALRASLDPAFVELDTSDCATPAPLPPDTWRARIREWIASSALGVVVDDEIDLFSGDCVVTYRSHDRVRAKLAERLRADAEARKAPISEKVAGERADAQLKAWGMDSPAAYEKKLDDDDNLTMALALKLFSGLLKEGAGITLLQCEGWFRIRSLSQGVESFHTPADATAGLGMITADGKHVAKLGLDDARRARLGVLLCPQAKDRGTLGRALIHELGHALGLAHVFPAPGAIDALHHGHACVMSYREFTTFCARCALHLRGWNARTVGRI